MLDRLCVGMLGRGGGRGVFLAVVPRGGGRRPLLHDALVGQVGARHVDVDGMGNGSLGGGQGTDDRLGAAQLDGGVEDIGAELEAALEGLGQLEGARGVGSFTGAAGGGSCGLDEVVVADGRRRAAEVELAGDEARHGGGGDWSEKVAGRAAAGGAPNDGGADRKKML